MPLEPGRYQVEVSAPGYRTHRAWVDHEQTWPHRIELERLTGGDGSSTLSVPNSVPTAQLPPDVQVDLNLRKAEQALRDGDAATARAAMERLVRAATGAWAGAGGGGPLPVRAGVGGSGRAGAGAGGGSALLAAAGTAGTALHGSTGSDEPCGVRKRRASQARFQRRAASCHGCRNGENSDVPARPESAIAGAATEEVCPCSAARDRGDSAEPAAAHERGGVAQEPRA